MNTNGVTRMKRCILNEHSTKSVAPLALFFSAMSDMRDIRAMIGEAPKT